MARTITIPVIPAEIFAGVRGHCEPDNAVGSCLSGTALGELFDVPPLVKQDRFLGPSANRDHHEKSRIVSPAGAFTALHLESHAMQGWMFLIAGRKTWTCNSPDCVGADFHPRRQRFYDSGRDALGDFPALAGCERYEGEIGAFPWSSRRWRNRSRFLSRHESKGARAGNPLRLHARRHQVSTAALEDSGRSAPRTQL